MPLNDSERRALQEHARKIDEYEAREAAERVRLDALYRPRIHELAHIANLYAGPADDPTVTRQRDLTEAENAEWHRLHRELREGQVNFEAVNKPDITPWDTPAKLAADAARSTARHAYARLLKFAAIAPSILTDFPLSAMSDHDLAVTAIVGWCEDAMREVAELGGVKFGPPIGSGGKLVPLVGQDLEDAEDLAAFASSTKERAMLFRRFIEENPSVQGVTMNGEWIRLAKEWVSLPTGIHGDAERRLLRRKIREAFPLLPSHLETWIGENDNFINEMTSSNLGLATPAPKTTAAVQAGYANVRWLDLPDAPPEPPHEQALTHGQLIGHVNRLSDYFRLHIRRMCETVDQLPKASPAPPPTANLLPEPDGIYPPSRFRFRGKEYRELTPQMVQILKFFENREQALLTEIMAKEEGAAWKKRYSPGNLPSIRSAFSKLNDKMGGAIVFSVNGDYVTKTVASL